MTRRTLFKLVALFPLVGPSVAKALMKSEVAPFPSYPAYLPPFFPKWDRAIDGLEEAGKWATEIERSRLPSNMVLPRVGQIWETVRDCAVSFRPCFSIEQTQAAGSDGLVPKRAWKLLFGGSTQLREGERIRVIGVDDPDKPLQVHFQPVRYEELHAGIVPEDIRCAPGYQGYKLFLKTVKTIPDLRKGDCQSYFNETFRLIAT